MTTPPSTSPTSSDDQRDSPSVRTTPGTSSSSSLTLSPRRRRRLRPNDKLTTMRKQLAIWSRVALALPTVDDADAVWDDFIDDDVKLTREQLRRLAVATQQTRQLQHEHATLQTLLEDHRLATKAIQALFMESSIADEWELNVQRWRALARIHFRPLSDDQCADHVAAVLRELRRVATSATDLRASGLTVMGWSDSECRLRDDSPALHFRLHKTFQGYDIDHYLDSIEFMFQDTTLYTAIIHGGRARAYVDVIQRLGPHVAVVMYHEQYPGTDATVHMLSLNARVETEDGQITQVYWPLDAPELMAALVGPTDVWMTIFHWAMYDVMRPERPRSSCDYRVSVQGTMRGHDLELLRYWRFRVFESLIRIETMAVRRDLLEF